MRAIVRPVLLLAAVGLVCTAARAQQATDETPRKKLSDAALFDVYYDFIATVRPIGLPSDRDQHERMLQPRILERRGPDTDLMADAVVTIGQKFCLLVEIDAYTGDVLTYRFTHHLNEDFRFPTVSGRPSPTQRWSEGPGPALVKRWLSLNTRAPLEGHERLVTWADGVWHVALKRKWAGYPYRNDTLFLVYTEEFGLLGLVNRLFSDAWRTKPEVERDDARPKADKYMAKLEEDEAEDFQHVWVIALQPMIVNPALLGLGGDEDALSRISFEEMRKTRLAHVFRYGEGALSPESTTRTIDVYVDAVTGDVLGHEKSWQQETENE